MDEDAVQDLADETRPQNEAPPLDLAAAFEGIPDQSVPDAAAAAPEPFKCVTAFVCYMDENGHWIADEKLLQRSLVLQREVSWNDYRHAVADIEADMLANDAATRAAQFTMQLQQQRMVQAVQAQQAQQIKEGLSSGVDLNTLKQMAAKGGVGGLPGMPRR